MSSSTESKDGDKAVASTGTMEIVVSAAFFLVGALVMWDSVRLGHRWGDDGPQAGYFPFYVSLIMLFASAVNILITLLGRGHAEKNAKAFVTWGQFKPVLAVFFPLVIYIGAMQFLGLYVSAALFIGMFMRINGKYGIPKILTVAIPVPVIVYVLFEKWFLVPLPKGPIEALLGL